MKRKVNWKVLLVSFIIVFGFLGGLGSLIMINGPNTSWYQSIKPAITPPNWVFPIAWNVLFILIAFSLYFVWMGAKKKEDKSKIMWAYGSNFIFNILWSLFFFGMKNPLLGFIDIIFVWFTIIVMIFVSGRINKRAAWLLVPYLLWVGFASVINGFVVFG